MNTSYILNRLQILSGNNIEYSEVLLPDVINN